MSAKSPSSELPLVSVFVGCYNHARFVIEALESVRLQTYPNIQLIIWDDCSQDNSVEVIEDWIRKHNVQCTFLAHKANLGICKSLNEVLSHSTGKYISGVAADDIWLPDKTSRQVQIMEDSANDVGVVYSNAFQVDENGDMLPQMINQDSQALVVARENWIFDLLWEQNWIPALTTLIRRECFTQVGPYDEDLCFEDWDMWMRISRKFRFVYDKIPAAKYRIVSTSMMQTMSKAMDLSTCLIRVKYYYHGWLNPEQQSRALAALDTLVWHQYQNVSRIPWRWKWTMLKQRCSAKTICLIICSTCSLSFARFQYMLTFCVAVKRRIRSRSTI